MATAAPEPTPLARPRPALLVAMGLGLARRGILAAFALVVSALTVVAMCVLVLVLRDRSDRAPLHDVPLLASSALAWGGGFALAFGVAVHALRRDVNEGLRHLLEARHVDLRGYLLLRVGGLAALLAIVVAGGTVVVGLVATLLGLGVGLAGRAAQATFASAAFGVAFAVVIAPTAVAALGARTRVGGYLFLASVVVLPEILVSALGGGLPSGLAEVLSIPSALAALRGALAPGGLDALRLARALASLAVFASLATALVHQEARSVRREEPT